MAKKQLFLFLFLFTTMFLLLGCGGVPQTTEPSGSESKPADTASAPSSEVEKPKNEYGVRGSAMILDENGVEIYEALGEYRVKSNRLSDQVCERA